MKKQGVIVEPVKNKQKKIYGIRFQYEGQTFKASEIGKEFGLRSLFLHYGQNIDGNTTKPKHFEKQQVSLQYEQNHSTTGIIGGLLDFPSLTSDFGPDEVTLQRQTQTKKKKRRGLGGKSVRQDSCLLQKNIFENSSFYQQKLRIISYLCSQNFKFAVCQKSNGIKKPEALY